VTHEEITKQELGGAMNPTTKKAASRILVSRDDAIVAP